MAVYGPWGCGRCHACQLSMENYCENWAQVDGFGGVLGLDGGMADYMLVPSARLLVPLGNLGPAKAAPLSDAALTWTTRNWSRQRHSAQSEAALDIIAAKCAPARR